MNKKIVSLVSLTGLIIVSLTYQNCARINYANSDGHINKSLIDGTLDDGEPPIDDNPPVIEFPASAKHKMTVAFEDLMLKTNYSKDTDIDYNDFVFTYSVREENESGNLKKIEIYVTPQARKAGHEAQLILSLQGPVASSGENVAIPAFYSENSLQAKIDYFNENDQLTSSQSINVNKPITVFNKTSEVFISQNANLEAGTSANPIKVLCKEKAKVKAKITITGFSQRPDNKARTVIDLKRYPFYLYVVNTQTLMGTIDLNPSHKTRDGFPMGFQIPGTFLHPADTIKVSSVYPYFNDFVKLLNGQSLDAATTAKAQAWYDWVTSDWAPKLACSPAL